MDLSIGVLKVFKVLIVLLSDYTSSVDVLHVLFVIART
jgi:hypothetical protein